MVPCSLVQGGLVKGNLLGTWGPKKKKRIASKKIICFLATVLES